jgi:hypothetical protein
MNMGIIMFENGTYVKAIVCGVTHYGYITDRRLKYGNEVIQYTIISDDETNGSEWLYVDDDKVEAY